MKKILTLVWVAAALLLSSRNASAQYFDHMALGVTVGIDGLGLEMAAPLGDQVRVRLGYSMLPPIWKPHKVFDINTSDGSGKKPVDVEGIFKMGGANLMVDWHPGGGEFFVSAGLYAGSKRILEARNKEPFLEESSWGKEGILVGSTVLTTDAKGIAHADLVYLPVRPYVGVGFGDAVKSYKRFGYMVELGACYTGSYKVTGKGYDTSTFENGTVRVTSADIDNQDKGVIDFLGKFPVLPILKFGFFVRLF